MFIKNFNFPLFLYLVVKTSLLRVPFWVIGQWLTLLLMAEYWTPCQKPFHEQSFINIHPKFINISGEICIFIKTWNSYYFSTLRLIPVFSESTFKSLGSDSSYFWWLNTELHANNRFLDNHSSTFIIIYQYFRINMYFYWKLQFPLIFVCTLWLKPVTSESPLWVIGQWLKLLLMAEYWTPCQNHFLKNHSLTFINIHQHFRRNMYFC